MYHVDLELTDEQVRQFKQLAFDRSTTVRGLATELVIREIQDNILRKNKKQKEETKN